MKILFFLLWAILLTNIYQIYILSVAGKNISLTYILLIVAFLVLLIKQIRKKNYSIIINLIKNSLILRYFLIFMVFLLISVLYSADKLDGLKICTMVSFGLTAYYLFFNVKLNIRKCSWGLIIATSLMTILMIFLSFNEPLKIKLLSLPIAKLFIEPDTLRNVLEGGWSYKNNIINLYRQGGFFVNTSIGGLYLGLNIALLFGLYMSENKLWIKITNQVLIILFMIALITTQSIGAIGSVLMTVFITTILILFRNFKLWKRLLLLYVVFILALCFGVRFNPSGKISMQKLIGTYEDNTFHSRDNIWYTSWKVTQANWFKGTGLSAKSWNNKYNLEAEKYKAPLNLPPHNMFLYVWGYSGLLALISFILLLGYLLYRNLKMFFKPPPEKQDIYIWGLVGFMCTLLLILVGMTENFLLAEPRISILFWSIMGLINAQSRYVF